MQIKGSIVLRAPSIHEYLVTNAPPSDQDCFKSEPTEIGGIKWVVTLFAGSKFPGRRDELKHCLETEHESRFPWTCKTEYAVRIVRQRTEGDDIRMRQAADFDVDNRKHTATLIAKKNILGSTNDYVINGYIEVVTDLTITTSRYIGFDRFITPGEVPSDITFRVGDEEVFADKRLLALVSSVFRDMFFGDHVDNANAITIEGISLNDFVEFLAAVNPCSPKQGVTDENVRPLLALADRYAAEQLILECGQFLFTTSAIPFYEKLHYSEKFRLHGLKDYLLTNMSRHELKQLCASGCNNRLSSGLKSELLERAYKFLSTSDDPLTLEN